MDIKLKDDFVFNPLFMGEFREFIEQAKPIEGYNEPDFTILSRPHSEIIIKPDGIVKYLEKQEGGKLRLYEFTATWQSKDKSHVVKQYAQLTTLPNCTPFGNIRISKPLHPYTLKDNVKKDKSESAVPKFKVNKDDARIIKAIKRINRINPKTKSQSIDGGVTADEIYDQLILEEYEITREKFDKRMRMLKEIGEIYEYTSGKWHIT